MTLLENDAFLTQLTKCFEKSKTMGTVYVTMKRFPDKPPSKSSPSESIPPTDNPDREYPCLVRAVLKNTKIRTIVLPADTERFNNAYNNIMKIHMDALKKKDRTQKKRKAKKATTTTTATKMTKATKA